VRFAVAGTVIIGKANRQGMQVWVLALITVLWVLVLLSMIAASFTKPSAPRRST
jgi:type II secretory pathway component PulK